MPTSSHSLLGGEVRAVKDIPDDENSPHVAEDGAVEAERHDQRHEQQMHALPELKGHLVNYGNSGASVGNKQAKKSGGAVLRRARFHESKLPSASIGYFTLLRRKQIFTRRTLKPSEPAKHWQPIRESKLTSGSFGIVCLHPSKTNHLSCDTKPARKKKTKNCHATPRSRMGQRAVQKEHSLTFGHTYFRVMEPHQPR